MDLAAADSLQHLSKCVETQLAELLDKVKPVEDEGDEQSPPTKRARTEEQDPIFFAASWNATILCYCQFLSYKGHPIV